MKHVLVIDDDAAMRRLIAEYLMMHALKVTAVNDSKQFNHVLSHEPVDLVVVDLNLGREDGLAIVRNLATKSDLPIIVISGDRFDEAEKVVALELGATDFIPKPFGMREFLARIRVALRQRISSPRTKDHRSFRFGAWKLSVKQRRLICAERGEVKLTACEFNLLIAFLENPAAYYPENGFCSRAACVEKRSTIEVSMSWSCDCAESWRLMRPILAWSRRVVVRGTSSTLT